MRGLCSKPTEENSQERIPGQKLVRAWLTSGVSLRQRNIVDLEISAPEMLRYYSGAASEVVAHARGGERVRFPAEILRRFVDHTGVRGAFVLRVDRNHKLPRIERI